MVGLTGGIGSGKSSVAQLLAQKGAVVVDADAIAREVVEPGMPALAALVERFGADILRTDGSLDRPALAKKAFVDEESRKALEAITWPAIGEEFFRRISEAPEGSIIVHDVPLLVEGTRGYDYGAVIVVEAPVEVRLARVEARGVARADAEARLAAQATEEERRKVATWVIANGGDLAGLEKQVNALWPELVRRAAAGAAERARPLASE